MRFPLPDPLEDLVFPTLADVIFFHDAAALIEGGREGMLDVQRLEAAVMRPQLALQYQSDLDLIGLAAYFWHGISASHGFVDANKRTAFLTAVAFLEANGVELIADPLEPGRMVLHWFKTDSFSVQGIEAYLYSRCRWKT